MIFLGRANIWDQTIWIAYSTLLMSRALPAYDKNLVVQLVILLRILPRSGLHCDMKSLLVVKGTPRYLNGRSPKQIAIPLISPLVSVG